ncbi:protein of unknown function DUF785 [Denitrovibrio acetiphilus DSM 12809]|uniref:Retropepsin-like aspartic endopeptidase domain-containing protein n=1 Tax=Denitrovibrio acetiphilus (strain DSM 12809 / NBRC 114555 / N2460) TaxID=522772 RepID=D4H7A6_DENA2|nr:RimK/LysX family protein [Denitrovibrio acetiphilus]ADD67905.1 protein of unknown function DUF785 [Denitrovibrio acetiphilus DSM 12809]
MKSEKRLKVIGLTDRIDFPEFDLFDIAAKIDTGAHTSSIHCHSIRTFLSDDIQRVAFKVLDPSHKKYCEKEIVMDICKIRNVKSSNGITETRYSVRTKVIIFNKTYSIELTLTNRKDMKFPVLIGSRMLSGKFIVDVSKKDLSYTSNR